MSNQLEIVPAEALPVARVPDVASMLQAVVEKGVSNENVEALEKLVGLYERMQSRDAEKDFAAALNKLQAECKNVRAVRPFVVNGQTRYFFAPYEDIMEEVAPLLEKHGFSVSFSTAFVADRIVKTLRLQHASGHFKCNDYSTKVSRPITSREGKEVVSEAQMESMASTTAKRGALADALNIVIEKYQHDDDARDIGSGEVVTTEQADELERRVAETNSNRAAFLKFAGSDKFATILSAKYDACDQMLRRKEGGR